VLTTLPACAYLRTFAMRSSSCSTLPVAEAARPSRAQHLFVVEDDDAMRDMLGSYLRQQGLTVTLMPRADTLLARVKDQAPDLVILDIGLPGLNGLDACSKLRRAGQQVPLILLTARADEVDRVLGLEMGADDYLVKPFSARELLARVRASLRRANGMVTGSPAPAPTEVAIGAHVLDVPARCLRQGHASRVLNAVEYALLAELVRAPGVTVTRERLLAVSHTAGTAVMPRAVDAAIMRLRKTLEPDPSNPRYIQTVRSQGYVFVP
jgi:two-component system phosphate regulon response regulator OmpR